MDQADAENLPRARGSVAGSEEALIFPATPRRSSNSRAFKVAGLTTLGCLLVASQVFTAYMVFNQREQIHSLQVDSERMAKQLTRTGPARGPLRVPMSSMPLLMDFAMDDSEVMTTEKPIKKLEDAVVSVEKELRKLNGTFVPNPQQINETESKNLESWLHQLLLYLTSLEKTATTMSPQASPNKTKCQIAAAYQARTYGFFKPKCDTWGNYLPMQCWASTGLCWCVDENGKLIEGTSGRGRPDCQNARMGPSEAIGADGQ